jgi:Protein of unknown function (DUF3277)
MQTYDPTKNKITINGNTMFGFGAGSIVKASRNNDTFTLQIGADGIGTRTLSADKSGKIELTLQASSPCNAMLSAQALQDELTGTGVGSCMIRDLSSLSDQCSAQNVWVVKPADYEKQKETGEITWTLETDRLNIFLGGIIDVPNAL